MDVPREPHRVQQGPGAPLRPRTQSPQRTSEVSPVGQRIQNVTYFEVEVDVTDANAQLLRPRMSGDAEIVTEVVEDALLVPEAALRYRGEQVYVEARDGEAGFAARDVRIGIVDGSRVQVAEGLVEGDEVTLR